MRRLSFKLILAVAIPLVAGLIAYAVLLRRQVEDRLIGDVVRYFLTARAEEVARRLEESLRQASLDAQHWARDPRCVELLSAYGVLSSDPFDERCERFADSLGQELRERGVYGFAALVHRSGRIVAAAAGSRDDGRANASVAQLGELNAAFEPWFGAALERPRDVRREHAEDAWIDAVLRLDQRREPLLDSQAARQRRFGTLYWTMVPRTAGGHWLCLVESSLPTEESAPPLERWWLGLDAAPAELERLLERLADVDATNGAAVARNGVLATEGRGWRVWSALAFDARGEVEGPAWHAESYALRNPPVASGVAWHAVLARLREPSGARRDLGRTRWMRAGPIGAEALPELTAPLAATQDLRDYGLSFAAPVWNPADPEGEPSGVILLHVAWAHIQEDILDRVAQDFALLHEGEHYESGYAFLFAADGDTIIGHQAAQPGLTGARAAWRPNYGTSLQRDHGLIDLHHRLTSQAGGVAPYEYPPGNAKTSGFRRTASADRGGFGWIVGVGIDDRDTRATVRFLGNLLVGGVLLLAVWSVLSIILVSRALTQPIRNLILFTNRLANGDLKARVPIRGNDELSRLGRAFNAMADALTRARERLVRAEKEAAWSEMARQIAHEIKNPLTPLRLSAQLLPRAYQEKPEQFKEILDRSVETILRSIDSLRGIAADFSRFAGSPGRKAEPLPCGEIIDEALALFRGMSEDGRIELLRTGVDGWVLGDREELRRVFINLIDNAFQALLGAARASGRIEVDLRAGPGDGAERTWQIEVRDDGPGIPPEAQARLFEPYFSTKTTGTGLGLAICRRIVREMGGEVLLRATGASGTVIEVTLPQHASGGASSTESGAATLGRTPGTRLEDHFGGA